MRDFLFSTTALFNVDNVAGASQTQDNQNDDANTPEPGSLESRIDDMVREGNGGEEDNAQAETQTGEAAQQQTGQQTGGQPKQDSASKQTDKQQTQQTGGADPQAQQNIQPGRIRGDQHGNLVDGNGNVVARAGKERRLFEENARLKHVQVPELTKRLEDTTRQLQQAQQVANAPQQYGLNNQEAVQGMQLVAAWKRDPLQVIQYVLAEAKAAGYDLSKIGLGTQLDTAAVNRMLDQKLGPLLQEQQQVQQQEQVNAQAARQYQAFIARHPDVSIHEEVIASMLAKDESLEPDAAYYKLKNFVLENGLDWSKPLQPQVAALQSGQQTQIQQNDTQKVPPIGGGRHGNARTVSTTSVPTVASADADYSDIVSEAMVEAGMKPR